MVFFTTLQSYLTFIIFSDHLPQFDDAYYVGASDISEEGNWKWISQNSSDFMTFKTNQPNNIDIHHPGLDADCAALRVTKRALVDEYCLQTKAYICEINWWSEYVKSNIRDVLLHKIGSPSFKNQSLSM